MLCPSCRRQLSRGAEFCTTCGAALPGSEAPLELVLPEGIRVPVVGEMTIGRAPGVTLQIEDPTVSRVHARVVAGNGGGPTLEDAGSSHGTFMDGAQVHGPVPLRDGAKITIGTKTINVERHRDEAAAGRTIVVKPGASLFVPAIGSADVTASATQFGFKPRMRSGYALKKLDASEGNKRYVLRDLRKDTFLRLSERDAQIIEMLDGNNSLIDLLGAAEQRLGAGSSARVARLLSDLGERGFLAGIASSQLDGDTKPPGFFKRMAKPREKTFAFVGRFFERLYEKGGWIFYTRPAKFFIAALALSGILTFGYLIAARYGTPFVVANKLGLGGLVFLLGRFAVVAVHETAHGLTMASFGRKVEKAGLKSVFIFPFAFVDTSEAWFESRTRRMAISGAGPVSDFSIGAIFALSALVVTGTVRDVFFNLAFAAYVGALMNLNPFLERDGYHLLVDWLREPGLRRRAKLQFERRLKGGKRETDNPVLGRYSLAALGWGVVAAGIAIFMSLRYYPMMIKLAPETVVKVVLGTMWVGLFIPVLWVVGKPLFDRMRGRGATA
jgi:putative peptide zinc metalloprotease protein